MVQHKSIGANPKTMGGSLDSLLGKINKRIERVVSQFEKGSGYSSNDTGRKHIDLCNNSNVSEANATWVLRVA
jgi:hypothetical protein